MGTTLTDTMTNNDDSDVDDGEAIIWWLLTDTNCSPRTFAPQITALPWLTSRAAGYKSIAPGFKRHPSYVKKGVSFFTLLNYLWRSLRPFIIMHVYIAPELGNPVMRRCTILVSPTQTCFQQAHIATPKGAYNACCHYRRSVTQTHIHHAVSGSHLYGWVNQSQHDSIAAPGASNTRPFGYQSN